MPARQRDSIFICQSWGMNEEIFVGFPALKTKKALMEFRSWGRKE